LPCYTTVTGIETICAKYANSAAT